ncbi:MAG TPA: hypothetical protein VGA09_15270 [Candidatus Binatia bacterium]
MFSAALIGGVMAVNGLILAKMLGLRSKIAKWGGALLLGVLTIYLALIWDSVVHDTLDRILTGSAFCA